MGLVAPRLYNFVIGSSSIRDHLNQELTKVSVSIPKTESFARFWGPKASISVSKSFQKSKITFSFPKFRLSSTSYRDGIGI